MLKIVYFMKVLANIGFPNPSQSSETSSFDSTVATPRTCNFHEEQIATIFLYHETTPESQR
jgi:hypothetical protein